MAAPDQTIRVIDVLERVYPGLLEQLPVDVKSLVERAVYEMEFSPVIAPPGSDRVFCYVNVNLRPNEAASELERRRFSPSEGCLCPKSCDCENHDAGLVSNHCPIHNVNPYPWPGCPVHPGKLP